MIYKIDTSDITVFQKYDNIFKNSSGSTIFQSYLWACFQSFHFKRECWLVVEDLEDNQTDPVGGLVIKYNLPFGMNYLYAPLGPIMSLRNSPGFSRFVSELEKLAKQEQSVFVRVDPRIDLRVIEGGISNSLALAEDLFIRQNRFTTSSEQKQPENTLVLDLSMDEKELLSSMKPKGRYNIKVAEKHGVTIIRETFSRDTIEGSQSFKRFYELMDETTKRDGFFGNTVDYYRDLLSFEDAYKFNDRYIYLYSAIYNGVIIASAITEFYGNTAIYYYGASSNENRNVMAPYLLQWQMIKDAKQFGCQYYDFLGVSPDPIIDGKEFLVVEGMCVDRYPSVDEAEKTLVSHKYYGITQFKTKFAGSTMTFPGAMDKILRPFWYKTINISKFLRRLLRKITKRSI